MFAPSNIVTMSQGSNTPPLQIFPDPRFSLGPRLVNWEVMISRILHRLKVTALMLYSQSVWHPDSIPPEEFKYRHLKRLWLPLVDLLCVLIGYMGVVYGSRILNESYPAWLVDTASTVFIAASLVALVGVAFPRLWPQEIAGKLVMLTLLGTYSASIWGAFFAGSVESGFVAAILVLPIILPLFRLQLLGEEIKQRTLSEHNDE